jgi:squalene cyclase
MKRLLLLVLFGVLAVALIPGPRMRAEELEPKYQKAVEKGLEWLAKQQYRDGHWDAAGGQYPMAMTALSGMAMLMEGSTIREGKYANNIKRAVDWFMSRSQPNGLLGNPNNPGEIGRYMYGHGFGVLFLSQVYGEEEDAERRKKLEDILTRGVEFIGRAQSTVGGWNYVSAHDGGGDGHEGSVTVTQMQALRAARNAGIKVPKEIIEKGYKYLQKSTAPDGGVQYSLGGGAGSGPLTAAGVCCSFAAGEYNTADAKKWLKFCQQHIPIDKSGTDRFGHYEYTQYYFAQDIYMLGEDGWNKLFPEDKNPLRWSKYRDNIFDYLVSRQNADGSWTQGYIGPVFNTACFLTILQLDKATLPVYQR